MAKMEKSLFEADFCKPYIHHNTFTQHVKLKERNTMCEIHIRHAKDMLLPQKKEKAKEIMKKRKGKKAVNISQKTICSQSQIAKEEKMKSNQKEYTTVPVNIHLFERENRIMKEEKIKLHVSKYIKKKLFMFPPTHYFHTERST